MSPWLKNSFFIFVLSSWSNFFVLSLNWGMKSAYPFPLAHGYLIKNLNLSSRESRNWQGYGSGARVNNYCFQNFTTLIRFLLERFLFPGFIIMRYSTDFLPKNFNWSDFWWFWSFLNARVGPEVTVTQKTSNLWLVLSIT